MSRKIDSSSKPDFEALKSRAHNLRWATVDEGVIPLTAADPDLPVSEEITNDLSEYIAVPHLCYGPPTGLKEFRQAVAAHFEAEKDAAVNLDQVIATNSAASAITLVARHLLTDGDEVIIQDPVDFLVAESVRRAGASLRLWRADDGKFTLDGLKAVVSDQTRIISVCHPHNPLGTLWTAGEVLAIAKFASERGIAIISDEVWSDVLLDGASITSFAKYADLACQPWVIYGLSKGFGLAGLRIGAVVAPSVAAASALALEQGFEHTIEGAATLSQIGAIAALTRCSEWRATFLEHCTQQRNHAVARLRALSGIRIETTPQATFVLFVDIRGTGHDEDAVANALLEHARVRVVPGSPRWFGPGAAGHIRLSLATTFEVLDEALSRIERAWPMLEN